MQKIKITVIRERKSLEKAEVEVEVNHGDFVDDVVGWAELAANDLKLWQQIDHHDYTYAPEEDEWKIAQAAAKE